MSIVLGAVIAGGNSSRYGSPKALARVGGQRIIDRVADSLSSVVDDVVLIANDELLAAAVGLPCRSDRIAGAGALGGIHTALLWASERGSAGIVAAACDMPFLSAPLLRRLVVRAGESDAPDLVAPESRGPRGLEPLCAYYATSCLPAVAESLERGDHRLIGFHDDVRVALLPLTEVARYGQPEIVFLNVNTPEERAHAERVAAGESA